MRTYNPTAGMCIEEAAAHLVELAKKEGEGRMWFDSISLYATAGSTSASIVRIYYDLMRHRLEKGLEEEIYIIDSAIKALSTFRAQLQSIRQSRERQVRKMTKRRRK